MGIEPPSRIYIGCTGVEVSIRRGHAEVDGGEVAVSFVREMLSKFSLPLPCIGMDRSEDDGDNESSGTSAPGFDPLFVPAPVKVDDVGTVVALDVLCLFCDCFFDEVVDEEMIRSI